MILEFYAAIWPAEDGRTNIPHDERIARAAYEILRSDGDWLYYAEKQVGPAPQPNRSARVEHRTKRGMGQWVGVRGSKQWFDLVEEWYIKVRDAWKKEAAA